MENSKSINEYYKDLVEWEKDISKSDKIVKGESFKNPIQINKNLIKKEAEKSKEKENKPVKIDEAPNNENENKVVKLKRDTNSIHEYYREWDKFKADGDEEKSDSEDKPSKPKGKNTKFLIYQYSYSITI
jgi:hypothetical protein